MQKIKDFCKRHRLLWLTLLVALAAAAVAAWAGFDLGQRVDNQPVYEIVNDDYTRTVVIPATADAATQDDGTTGLYLPVPLKSGQRIYGVRLDLTTHNWAFRHGTLYAALLDADGNAVANGELDCITIKDDTFAAITFDAPYTAPGTADAEGTSALQKYVRRQGIKQMKITATEDRMHKSGDPYLNHTRPSSAVRLLEKFIQQELLSPVYQKFLENTMIATSTGSDKLKGLLPAETIIGHKTGSSDRDSTGMKAGDNDMGFVYLPHGGDHYTIAVFITDSMEDDKTNAAIIAQISKAVYDYINEISS